MEAVKERCSGKCIVSENNKYKMEGTGSNIEIWDFEICDFKKLNKFIIELDWKIFKQDWRLADEEKMLFSRAITTIDQNYKGEGKGLFLAKDIKTFIQKVKEDIDKESTIAGDIAKTYLDKRAGDL